METHGDYLKSREKLELNNLKTRRNKWSVQILLPNKRHNLSCNALVEKLSTAI